MEPPASAVLWHDDTPQPASLVNFTRPEITEEEMNSEAELLRDEDLLEQVAQIAESRQGRPR